MVVEAALHDAAEPLTVLLELLVGLRRLAAVGGVQPARIRRGLEVNDCS